MFTLMLLLATQAFERTRRQCASMMILVNLELVLLCMIILPTNVLVLTVAMYVSTYVCMYVCTYVRTYVCM